MENLTKPQKSERLVSFTEFTTGKSFKRSFLAGFKKYAKKEFMSEEQWKETLSNYQTR